MKNISKLTRWIFLCSGVLIIILINSELIKKYINDNKSTLTLLDIIMKLELTPIDGIPVNIALNIPPKNYICILYPYVSRVEFNTAFESDVNNFLSMKKYLGDEGNWTLIHGVGGKWILELIPRKKIELDQLRFNNNKKLDSMCGEANSIKLIKLLEKKVNFIGKY